MPQGHLKVDQVDSPNSTPACCAIYILVRLQLSWVFYSKGVSSDKATRFGNGLPLDRQSGKAAPRHHFISFHFHTKNSKVDPFLAKCQRDFQYFHRMTSTSHLLQAIRNNRPKPRCWESSSFFPSRYVDPDRPGNSPSWSNLKSKNSN